MKIKSTIQIILISLLCHSVVRANGLVKIKALSNAKDSIRFRVYYDRIKPHDTLTMTFYPNLLDRDPVAGLDKFTQLNAVMQKDSGYQFVFAPKAKIGYVSIKIKNLSNSPRPQQVPLMALHLAEAGDDIIVHVTYSDSPHSLVPVIWNMHYRFSGPSMQKYNVGLKIDSARAHAPNKNIPLFDKEMNFNENNSYDEDIRAALHQVELAKGLFNIDTYYLIKANVFYGQDRSGKYGQIKDKYHRLLVEHDTNAIKEFKRAYLKMAAKDTLVLPEKALYYSNVFMTIELAKLNLTNEVLGIPTDGNHVFDLIVAKYSGIVRDKMIIGLLSTGNDFIKDYNTLLDKATGIITSDDGTAILRHLKERKTGILAYNFNLPNAKGEQIQLSNFRGKIVFIDFWYTGCENCAGYYEHELSKAEKEFSGDHNIVFVSVSIDKDKKKWIEAGLKSGLYTSPEEINLYTGGQGSDALIIKKYSVIGYPTRMLIGHDGRILKFEEGLLKYASIVQTIKKAESKISNK